MFIRREKADSWYPVRTVSQLRVRNRIPIFSEHLTATKTPEPGAEPEPECGTNKAEKPPAQVY